ncbi:MAG TPA: GspE/PulE family protein [Candidatus Babeliales bacterium]|nr:GspE/PulE family protein [Candidatus Babeliales bacterium]
MQIDRTITEYSAVDLVDKLIMRAIECKASDIHCEPLDNLLRIRYRIDGVLYDQPHLPESLALQILSRIKILAHTDIAEKRIPQDGKFRVRAGIHEIDLRVSTFPSMHGQKIVIRILDRQHMTIALNRLGLQLTMYETLSSILNKQSGFFLVTGPTGSGKTTTLYAALSALNSPEKNIITLEDPVEYHIEGITQGHIQSDIGFTFARGIRAMLRQDPDVVMVGEIRDIETAKAAIEASLTGHLVLSTLHTTDAPGALMRLMDMGIEPFLINASVSGILAQRLVRRLCTACKIERLPTDDEKIILERLDLHLQTVFSSTGCSACLNLGYKGRIGIFELLMMSHGLRALVVHKPIFDAIAGQAKADGMATLLEDAKYKVQQGIISLAELVRVLL